MISTRRDFLFRAGSAAGAALLAPALLRAQDPAAREAAARQLVLLWLSGGPSHLDTFDLKPNTAVGGPFQPITTAVEGISICQHLPRIAEQAQHLALVRSLTSAEADHGRALLLARTGYLPQETVAYPGYPSVLAQRSAPTPLPPFVALCGSGSDPGFLGPEWAPLLAYEPDTAAALFTPPADLPERRIAERRKWLERLNQRFAARGDRRTLEAEEVLQARSAALASVEVAGAFDLSQEPQAARDRYGDTSFGRGCLLARRLVERGAPVVEVVLDGWDTHENNFEATQELMGALDPAFASLVQDLAERDLLRSTLIVCMGEFGRTPEINGDEGRDHHSTAFSAVLAGGGVRGGQVIGATDAEGRNVLERPVAPEDLIASVYQAFGHDPRAVNVTPEGRPVRLLERGTPIAGLLV
jgi:uncharacterized protein (DUF1501 family)